METIDAISRQDLHKNVIELGVCLYTEVWTKFSEFLQARFSRTFCWQKYYIFIRVLLKFVLNDPINKPTLIHAETAI